MSELSRFYSAKRRVRMKTFNRKRRYCEDCDVELPYTRKESVCLPCQNDRRTAPNPEEIKLMCLDIQETWSPREKKIREGTLNNRVEVQQIHVGRSESALSE